MDTSKAIVEKIRFPLKENESFVFDVKRDDLIDPIISGNKWRKLQYNILKMQQLNKSGIITFGGAYSNHLVATAKAAKNVRVHAIGIVRGEELTAESNATLKACAHYGMELVFVSRSAYRGLCATNSIAELFQKYPNHYIVPEGGRNYYGVIGCQHILPETNNDYDHVYLAGGTGTTAAGVLLSANEKTKVHLVSALKGDFLYNDIQQLLLQVLYDEELVKELMQRLEVVRDDSFGGYGKVNAELLDFINEFYKKTKLKLDPIYTGKVAFQMVTDFRAKARAPEAKVLFIHTGGLQGAQTWKGKIDWVK